MILVLGGLLFTGCKEKENDSMEWKGSGVHVYFDEVKENVKPIRIFYFVPENAKDPMPVLMVFHGIERNAMEYRDALISKASEKGFILIVPEFSEENFPGNNAYILGNMFPDGELPAADSLRPVDEWSFSAVPRILQFVRLKTSLAGNQVFFIGHSAGAQFLHRTLLFLPELEAEASVVSAAGWYTLPDNNIKYPYGTGLTSTQLKNYSSFFNRKMYVQVGNNDNNPNSSNLRHTPEADVQGLTRLKRAEYFYERSNQIADSSGLQFNWSFHIIPNLNHNFVEAINHSADLLFE